MFVQVAELRTDAENKIYEQLNECSQCYTAGVKIDGFHRDKRNVITWPLIKHHSLSGVIKLQSVLLTSADT